jgi:hypothetical protein
LKLVRFDEAPKQHFGAEASKNKGKVRAMWGRAAGGTEAGASAYQKWIIETRGWISK